MTLVEILCNRTRICRPGGASNRRSDAPLFILEIVFGTHYAVTRPALARFRSAGASAGRSNLARYALSGHKFKAARATN